MIFAEMQERCPAMLRDRQCELHRDHHIGIVWDIVQPRGSRVDSRKHVYTTAGGTKVRWEQR